MHGIISYIIYVGSVEGGLLRDLFLHNNAVLYACKVVSHISFSCQHVYSVLAI